MERPNSDEILAQKKGEDAERGKLKIFFGAIAGVGKTYAMIEAARKRKRAGADIVVGYVETHKRAETEALLEGLDILPPKLIPYKNVTLSEFDVDAALARKPRIILVDEMAHSNAPGSRHLMRWQDIEELLDKGIDVYTTLNVQYCESANNVVAQITGVRVRETVPDSFVERADELELVDLSSKAFFKRLKEGKVCLGEQAERAAQNFFKPENLIVLRQLALRYLSGGDAEERQVVLRRVTGDRFSWKNLCWPLGIVVLCTMACHVLFSHLAPVNLIMIYLLGGVWIAYRYGRRMSIVASVLSVLCFDFFFVPPYYSLAVANIEYVFTLIVMLVVGLMIAYLTEQLRRQTLAMRLREDLTLALYSLSRNLSKSCNPDDLFKIARMHIVEVFRCRAVIFTQDANGKFAAGFGQIDVEELTPGEVAVAQWVFEHKKPAGKGTDTFSGSKGIYLPFSGAEKTVGVVGIFPHGDDQFEDSEQYHLLEMFVSITALVVEGRTARRRDS